MISIQEKTELLSKFLENTSEKTAFIHSQRLLWEKSIFPTRFPSCSTFLCSICKSKTHDLSICLTCGHIYCLKHFGEHSCNSSFGVDISTKQLFIYDLKYGRRFIFDSLIDRLIVSAKLAVIDGIPFYADLDPSTPILPLPKIPMPLYNLGNTCWLNVIIQCFMANPLIEKWFLSGVYQIEECDDSISALHVQFQKLFLSQNGESTFSLSDFLFCLWAHFNDLWSSEERDSQEYFMKIRTSLDDFYQKKFNTHEFGNIFNWKFKVVESCEFCEKTHSMLIPESSMILQINNCNNINEAIYYFLNGESPMKCSVCERSSRKQYFFHTFPKTLTIVLGRSYQEDRSLSPIKLEETIYLDKFVDQDEKKDIQPVVYSLITSVVRPKSGDSGHFWAHVKRNNHWFRCDDSSIKPIDISEVLRDNAYVLFYIKKGFMGTF